MARPQDLIRDGVHSMNDLPIRPIIHTYRHNLGAQIPLQCSSREPQDT